MLAAPPHAERRPRKLDEESEKRSSPDMSATLPRVNSQGPPASDRSSLQIPLRSSISSISMTCARTILATSVSGTLCSAKASEYGCEVRVYDFVGIKPDRFTWQGAP